VQVMNPGSSRNPFESRCVGMARNVQRFRGGLVLKALRLCVSLNSRLESNKEEDCGDGQARRGSEFGRVKLMVVAFGRVKLMAVARKSSSRARLGTAGARPSGELADYS